MGLTLNLNSGLVHRRQTLQWHSSFITTVMQDIRKEPLLTGIPRNVETLFLVYMGMAVYAKIRKRNMVEMLHENNLSISCDRVLEVSAQLGDAAISKYVGDVLCPRVLRKGIFKTSAWITDHNPTATTAVISFHGTSISIFQPPISKDKGEQREPLKLGENKKKSVPEHPPGTLKKKRIQLLPKVKDWQSQALSCWHQNWH